MTADDLRTAIDKLDGLEFKGVSVQCSDDVSENGHSSVFHTHVYRRNLSLLATPEEDPALHSEDSVAMIMDVADHQVEVTVHRVDIVTDRHHHLVATTMTTVTDIAHHQELVVHLVMIITLTAVLLMRTLTVVTEVLQVLPSPTPMGTDMTDHMIAIQPETQEMFETTEVAETILILQESQPIVAVAVTIVAETIIEVFTLLIFCQLRPRLLTVRPLYPNVPVSRYHDQLDPPGLPYPLDNHSRSQDLFNIAYT